MEMRFPAIWLSYSSEISFTLRGWRYPPGSDFLPAVESHKNNDTRDIELARDKK